MLKMIQLEWLKWRKHNAFRILMLAYVILLPVGFLTAKRIPELPPPIGSPEVLFIFPTVWTFLGYFGSWLIYFLFGLFAVMLVTMEYHNKTLRQNIITGLDRTQFFIGKMLFIGTISGMATLYFAICALLIGFFNTDYLVLSKVMQNIDYTGRYFLMTFGYMVLGVFFGFWIKRTGLSIIMYLAYTMFIEVILRWAIHFNLFKHRSMHFYPVKALSDTIPVPEINRAEKFLQEFDFSLFLEPWESFLLVGLYSTLFLFLSYRILTRSDL